MPDQVSRSVSLTDDEMRGLIELGSGARSVVKSLSATNQIKYMKEPWWSALTKLEEALDA